MVYEIKRIALLTNEGYNLICGIDKTIDYRRYNKIRGWIWKIT
jgi:hypothetical protein